MLKIKLNTICCFNFVLLLFSILFIKLIFNGSFILLFNSLKSLLFPSKKLFSNKIEYASIISHIKILIIFLLLFISIILLICS